MGKPLDPSPLQVQQLNRETALPPPERTHLTDGKLQLELEPNALVLVNVDR
jgi:xylan 1,4-beta-xylosidase